jgi:CelD/BcsL family acetyltransferase involved in cellulose biosynthesis
MNVNRICLMECTIVEAANLSNEHRARWSALARQQPAFDAPAFHPEFVCGLAQHIPGCKVAILRRGASAIGYLPFAQTADGKVAGPVPMCDYQPIILAPDYQFDARATLRALGLRSWIFENVLAHQLPTNEATHLTIAHSPRVLLADGFAAYRAELEAAGKSGRNVQTKIKLLRRDHGPVELIHNVADEGALSRLLQFKAARYAPNGQFPFWVRDALAHFHQLQIGPVTGHLSILKASQQEVAYLFCLKLGELLYFWFPTFDPAFRRYSPGMVALWLLIADIDHLGCSTIDLGPGGEAYKAYFANNKIEIGSGRVDSSAVVAATRRTFRHLEQSLRSSHPAQIYIKPAVRLLRRARIGS